MCAYWKIFITEYRCIYVCVYVFIRTYRYICLYVIYKPLCLLEGWHRLARISFCGNNEFVIVAHPYIPETAQSLSNIRKCCSPILTNKPDTRYEWWAYWCRLFWANPKKDRLPRLYCLLDNVYVQFRIGGVALSLLTCLPAYFRLLPVYPRLVFIPYIYWIRQSLRFSMDISC